MSNEVLKAHIPEEFSGQRLDKVLASLFPEYSRAKLVSWLKEGNIKINSKSSDPDFKVFGDEEIIFSPINTNIYTPSQAENIPLNIIFEDEDLIIINKQAGLIVHPGAGNPDGTLVNALLHHNNEVHSKLPRAGIIHRIDKDTSGLLVIAKTITAHNNLIQQMQDHLITRRYIALVFGHIIAGQTIKTNFGRDNQNRLKMAVKSSGREAITNYRVAKHYGFATLLNVELETGRTHQIRVHLAHINHAIIGDQLYKGRNCIPKGLSEDLRNTIQKFPRQALHACSLAFTHPVSKQDLEFQAPLPDDFQQLLITLDDELNGNNNTELAYTEKY
ncbi:MAG: RNA pseudouridine synthase [Legionellales bacterium RIFCSPHIGHO2_12_FULL_35_11]|nr:MAG: RNA pseudouridine synthase [Legionellales bacterium RIFCSPHIGHO2_12_FULL_35_11]